MTMTLLLPYWHFHLLCLKKKSKPEDTLSEAVTPLTRAALAIAQKLTGCQPDMPQQSQAHSIAQSNTVMPDPGVSRYHSVMSWIVSR